MKIRIISKRFLLFNFRMTHIVDSLRGDKESTPYGGCQSFFSKSSKPSKPRFPDNIIS